MTDFKENKYAFLFENKRTVLGWSKRNISFHINSKQHKNNFLKLKKEGKFSFRSMVEATQPHSSVIHEVKVAPPGFTLVEGSDGLVTSTRGVLLAVRTADCMPLFFWNRHQVGVLHCGWRSLQSGILENLKKAVLLDKTNFLIGCGIRGCCYKVGEEFRKFFRDGLSIRNGCLFFDMPEMIRKFLEKNGARKIYDCGICTSCNVDKFFSARAEKTDKRMINFIVGK